MDYKLLDNIHINEKDLYGSKATNLANLIQNGMQVPRGYVLSTVFTQRIVEQNYQLRIKDQEQLKELFKQFDGHYIAVRSSGSLEDLSDSSFAGQYDTVLDIQTYGEFENAIIRCIKSSFSDHASDYSLEKTGTRTKPIALIAQQMIQGDAFGVMFTANPLTENRYEAMITSALNYGFGVVDGTSELEKVLVDKYDSKNIIDRKSDLHESEVHQKLSRNQIVTNDMLGKFLDVCLTIEELMGHPQDVEWVMKKDQLHILQTRNITSLYPIDKALLDKDKRHLYMCYNTIIQGMTAPYTPLGYEFWRCTFAGYTSIFYNNKKKVLYPNWIKFINGRIYYDLTEVLGRRFLGPSFLSGLDDKDPDGGKLLKELYKTNKKTFLRQGGKFRLSYGLVKWGISLTRYGKISKKNIDLALNQAIDMGNQYIKQLETRIDHTETAEDKVTLMQDVTEELLTLSFKQVMYISYGLKAMGKWEKWFAKHYPHIDLNPLKLALPNNPTTEMGLSIMGTAMELSKNNLQPDPTQPLIINLLEAYGHRSDYDTDLGKQRWSEDPDQMVQMVRHYMNDNIATESYEKHQEQEKQATLFINELNSLIKKDHTSRKAKQMLFDFENYRTLVGLREMPKFNMVKALAMIRTMFLTLGDNFVKDGKIDCREDMSFLLVDEILEINKINARKLISERKSTYASQSRYSKVPRFILSTGEVYYNSALNIESSQKSDRLEGVPLSSGRVIGQVKILKSPFESPISGDEILVTHNTDPSWTPLFPTIKGLLMESGGPISHGAIVAREYGLPAVGGIPNALALLKDGDTIEMDGVSGVVLIINRA